MSDLELGKLESVHPTSPVYLQRAAVLAILSVLLPVLLMIDMALPSGVSAGE